MRNVKRQLILPASLLIACVLLLAGAASIQRNGPAIESSERLLLISKDGAASIILDVSKGNPTIYMNKGNDTMSLSILDGVSQIFISDEASQINLSVGSQGTPELNMKTKGKSIRAGFSRASDPYLRVGSDRNNSFVRISTDEENAATASFHGPENQALMVLGLDRDMQPILTMTDPKGVPKYYVQVDKDGVVSISNP